MGSKGKSIFETQNSTAPGVTINDVQSAGDASNGAFNPWQGSDLSTQKVYMGQSYQGSTLTKNYLSYQDAALAPTTWDQKQLSQFVNSGIIHKITGFSPGMGMPQIQAAWQSMVDASVLFNSNLKDGQSPWSPQDVMDTWSDNKGKFGTMVKDGWKYDVATGERIAYMGPKTKTTTSTNIDLSSAEQVQAIATSALQQALGRNPNAKELAQFKSTIAGFERANPTRTTTTQTLTPDLATGTVDVSNQSSTTTGGVTDAARAQLIQNQEQGTPEYNKYQQGNYFQMLMGMLGGMK